MLDCPCDFQREQVKIDATFAAVEGRVLRRVNENLKTIFEFSRWREINESVVTGVKTADEAGDAAGGSSEAKIDGAVDFDVKIRIADDELKCGVVWTAREKFLGCRRALRVCEIQRELPVLREIVNLTGGPP